VNRSSYCELRCGCTVISHQELKDGVIVGYQGPQGSKVSLKASWLVGADGKTGVVRKKFLESTAGIRQEIGLRAYDGTWIAANLKITPPTPTTHPDLCLWEMGLSPEDVYDLFWPDEWHFCSPPGKPTAAGRFGPSKSYFWRHEFAEPDWDDSKDAEEILWEHMTPMITRKCDRLGRTFPSGNITFPRDCIDVRRCRPFTFCHKVVNKWFHKRTILIGDAAHVFPPFGGQGIVSGIRDGDALAWRLAILLHQQNNNNRLSDNILQAWACERRQGVDDSARLTMSNGQLCNNPETWGFYFSRTIAALLSYIPGVPPISKLSAAYDKEGYKTSKGGFFLMKQGGGGKIAQIYVRTEGGEPKLSDLLLQHGKSVFTLFIFGTNADDVVEARTTIRKSGVPNCILSEESIVRVSTKNDDFGVQDKRTEGVYRPCPVHELTGLDVMPGYTTRSYGGRFPKGTKFAIVRPDLIIYSAARTVVELQTCMEMLNVQLQE
jgi:2-polyprenyl-6-methoxyphenol hydroxylase-like FAD-dependent oxidoreductase